jgi:hypothetical protein
MPSGGLNIILDKFHRRLGVGAPIPESTSLSRDSARLKTRLISKGGNKRARGSDDGVQESPSDNEDESRAGAIRKKVKVDPFGGMNGRKNKPTTNGVTGLLTPHRTLVSAQDTTPKKTSAEIDSMDVDEGPVKKSPPQADGSIASPSQPPSARKKKKKRKKHTEPHTLPTPKPSVENVEVHPRGSSSPHSAAVKVAGSPVASTSGIILISAICGLKRLILCTYSALITAPSKSALAELRTPEPIDVSLISTPKSLLRPRSQQMQMSPVLKFPVLNLNGPPPEIDVDDNNVNNRSESPKKKRKRKKKRKSSMANLPANGGP